MRDQHVRYVRKGYTEVVIFFKYDIWVLRMVTVKITVFWDVTPRRLVAHYQCVGGTCCLHLKGRIMKVHRIPLEVKTMKMANHELLWRSGEAEL